ncbi:hypothetical protein MWN34_10775 [Ancylobacter sp. 6x-1]|uniref:Chromosome partitioning protein ParB n=1 Tax=Ancylobacter crimeensis TaxID=2579147 RepID=A0ABT0DBR5_9HYPH|nr:hypothetical protein [Ancylobacter crimeensis]MCK0197396.1 hypothetical protein [Ancylobacter crimeensis]
MPIAANIETSRHYHHWRNLWGERKRMHLSPPTIRRALTENTIPATHKLARFVGIDAYTAAGGAVMRDLFDMQNEGFLTDSALLMQLATDKLTAAEAEVRAEGWKWVRSELETDHSIRYGRIVPLQPLTTEDDEEAGEEGAEYDKAETYRESDDDTCEEDAEPEEDDSIPPVYGPEDLEKAGALLRITRDGTLDILRGLVHPDDQQRPERQGASDTVKPDAAKGEYAATIVEDLTAHKTAAIRLELSCDTAMALAVTVHAMTLELLYPYATTRSCIKLRVERVELTGRVKAQEDCPAHAALQQQKEHWVGILPENAADLFEWCIKADAMTLFNLLAFCTAMSVTAVRERHWKGTPLHLRHAEQLAQALKLDMTKHWQGTADGFYGNVPKAALVHAVSEASAPMAVSVSNLKKQEAARYVAKAMAGTGWLPAPLRSVESATVEGGQDEARIDISQAIAA